MYNVCHQLKEGVSFDDDFLGTNLYPMATFCDSLIKTLPY